MTPVVREPFRSDTNTLEIAHVTARFGGVTALTDATFELPAGAMMAVIGPNGAGKSTLLNCVSGLIRKNSTGSVVLDGTSILGESVHRIARRGVGRSFQDPPLIDQVSVMENVLGGAHLRLSYGLAAQIFLPRRVVAAEAAERARAAEVLEFVGLTHRAERAVGGLPYGTRKLVDIARAMMCSSSLLMLDEPTSGLDSNERHVVKDLLLRIRAERRMTVLIVEHHMDLVRDTADLVLGLQAGNVLSRGTAAEVLDSAEFRAALVGTGPDQSGPTQEEPR